MTYYSRDPDNPRYVLHIRKNDSETWCYTYMALDNVAHKNHMRRVQLTGWILISEEIDGRNKVVSSDGRYYRLCQKCLRAQARMKA